MKPILHTFKDFRLVESGKRLAIQPNTKASDKPIWHDVYDVMSIPPDLEIYAIAMYDPTNAAMSFQYFTGDHPLVLTVSRRGVRVIRKSRFLPKWQHADSVFLEFLKDHLSAEEVPVFMDILLTWSQKNGFFLDRSYHSPLSTIYAMLYPFYRDIYVHGLVPFHPTDTYFYGHRFKTFKRAVKSITGYDTPSMLKLIGSNLTADITNMTIAVSSGMNSDRGPFNEYMNWESANANSPMFSSPYARCYNYFRLSLAKLFKNFIPVDILKEIMQSDTITTVQSWASRGNLSSIHTMMAQMSPSARIRLARTYVKLPESLDHNVNLQIFDSARMFCEYPDKILLPKKYKTTVEFHDGIVKQYNLYQEEKFNRPIEYPEWVLSIERPCNGMEVKLARHASELIEWGKELNHCIGSYRDMAVNQKSILLALYREGKLTYNAELQYVLLLTGDVGSPTIASSPAEATRLVLRQLHGQQNKAAEESDQKAFEELVKEVKPKEQP